VWSDSELQADSNVSSFSLCRSCGRRVSYKSDSDPDVHVFCVCPYLPIPLCHSCQMVPTVFFLPDLASMPLSRVLTHSSSALLALLQLDFSGQRWRTLEVGVTVLPCIRGTRCSAQGLSVRVLVLVCWGVGVSLRGSLVSGA
jgi:hypothetical protein